MTADPIDAVARKLLILDPPPRPDDRRIAAEEATPRPVLWSNVRPGGDFILDQPDTPPAIWGQGQQVAWAEGESLFLCGPPGVGKSTVAGQLVRGLLGLTTMVLGMPIQQATKPVLYMAMDRPRQIARAFARTFTEAERDEANRRLAVWPGPPPADLGRHPEMLTELANGLGVGTIVLDSLKDAALKLSEDEVGGSINRGIQMALAEGIDVLVLHHQRKSGSQGGKPRGLDDVYGSAFITAGAGSVILLWGEAGDPIVELTHLKQPAEEVGPFTVEHHPDGTSTVAREFDAYAFLVGQPNGATATATDAARVLFGTATPSDAQRKKAQRKLDHLVAEGRATKTPATKGGAGGTTGARYRLTGEAR